MCALFAQTLSLSSSMKVRGGTDIFGKSIARLLFAVHTALCRSTHIASMTCEAMCGPSIGMGSPYIILRKVGLAGGERGEETSHVD